MNRHYDQPSHALCLHCWKHCCACARVTFQSFEKQFSYSFCDTVPTYLSASNVLMLCTPAPQNLVGTSNCITPSISHPLSSRNHQALEACYAIQQPDCLSQIGYYIQGWRTN